MLRFAINLQLPVCEALQDLITKLRFGIDLFGSQLGPALMEFTYMFLPVSTDARRLGLRDCTSGSLQLGYIYMTRKV